MAMDSGAEVCADAPTAADLMIDHPFVTSTRGVFGEPRDYDTTDKHVVLIPKLPRPIIAEVRLADETEWRKTWVNGKQCLLVRWGSPAAEKLHQDYIKAHAAEVRELVIEDGQTKMPWAVYNTIQADLGLSRPHEGNDGRDRTRTVACAGTEDGVSPGSDAYKHRASSGTKFNLKPAPGRHILIQTLLISTVGFPIGCELNPQTRNSTEVEMIKTASGPVSLCPLRRRDEDNENDGSDDDRELGKRGRKRPRYGPEEWVDTTLSDEIEYVFGFSRAVGMGGHGKLAHYPLLEYGRVVWFADLTEEKQGLKDSRFPSCFGKQHLLQSTPFPWRTGS